MPTFYQAGARPVQAANLNNGSQNHNRQKNSRMQLADEELLVDVGKLKNYYEFNSIQFKHSIHPVWQILHDLLKP